MPKHRWLLNIFITFSVSGFWHGANWTFVFWGALNGIYLIFEILFRKNIHRNFFNILLTFTLVNFSRPFFRANSISDAFTIFSDMFTNPGKLFIPANEDIIVPIYAIMAFIILLAIESKKEYFDNLFSFSRSKYELVRLSYYSIILFLILFLGVFDGGQFIYFRF